MNILVTGGAGYIGSHVTLSLLDKGYNVIVLDNFSNSSPKVMNRIKKISEKTLKVIQGDILDSALLATTFKEHSIDAVFHFAGLKSVAESTNQPGRYYQTNVTGTLNLCQAMITARVFNLVFSSSATVYGEKHHMPLRECYETGTATNPYGRSKYIAETILKDLAAATPQLKIAVLRYFNPIGAHPSGLIGENPSGIPNNLLPYIGKVATGQLPELCVHGSDYPTIDGTGVRDYIHVMDLAYGHVKALEALSDRSGVSIWNLGTGKGYSVLEMIEAFEKSSGCTIPFKFGSRRDGDIPASWADISKIQSELQWEPRFSLDQMMSDTWRWLTNNPWGYEQ
ncbi:UDP-glucose 4-epimerase GalE [Pseudomonas sp. PSB11]|uniref:UDP-glucose 4-epimerase GalE n=1 Tax=Pseudomonas sp. PSB11 TaxID=2021969 RepID=UPI0016608C02|nr:UDP-glucose 4-epimerase GalE [Pseudomonas sp. PSB11]MBD0679814.1 UDP-glucose 4-epimerase GalE [Pseudomonas sp. PSB11]